MADENKETLTPEQAPESPAHDPGITDFRRPMVEAAAAGGEKMPAATAHAVESHGEAHVDFLSDTTVIMAACRLACC